MIIPWKFLSSLIDRQILYWSQGKFQPIPINMNNVVEGILACITCFRSSQSSRFHQGITFTNLCFNDARPPRHPYCQSTWMPTQPQTWPPAWLSAWWTTPHKPFFYGWGVKRFKALARLWTWHTKKVSFICTFSYLSKCISVTNSIYWLQKTLHIWL